MFLELVRFKVDLARKLELTISGVGYAVQRGEAIALHHNYHLPGKVI